MIQNNKIIAVINNLYEIRIQLFEQILNFGMTTELSHLADAFDNGDIFTFDLTLFENSENINLQKLIELCKKTDETIFTLMNLNNISENEVNFY